jgi:hypothetical protein
VLGEVDLEEEAATEARLATDTAEDALRSIQRANKTVKFTEDAIAARIKYLERLPEKVTTRRPSQRRSAFCKKLKSTTTTTKVCGPSMSVSPLFAAASRKPSATPEPSLVAAPRRWRGPPPRSLEAPPNESVAPLLCSTPRNSQTPTTTTTEATTEVATRLRR